MYVYTPALNFLHALQMIIPCLLCIVISWNCEKKVFQSIFKCTKNKTQWKAFQIKRNSNKHFNMLTFEGKAKIY